MPMKTNINKLESLLQLAETNFKMLCRDNTHNTGYIAAIKVANYSDSLFIASDLIKLCMIAMNADENHLINLTNVLEIVLQFLPFEEMEVLDELQEILESNEEMEERIIGTNNH